MSIGIQTCDHCGKKRTPEGHDGCIGTLEGVMNACCGHGNVNGAYIQFNHADYNNTPNKYRIAGKDALKYIQSRKKGRNPSEII